MKKLFALSILALAACSPPQGQGFGQYSISNYLNGGSGQAFAFDMLAKDDGDSVPGLGTLPNGYIAGLERIENGQHVTYAANALTLQPSNRVKKSSAKQSALVYGRGSVEQAQAAEVAFKTANGAAAYPLVYQGQKFRLVQVDVGGQNYAVVTDPKRTRSARDMALMLRVQNLLPCPGTGQIYQDSGRRSNRFAFALNCS